MGRKREAQALLRSFNEDGSTWLFVVLRDDQWLITCDGQEVAAGAGGRASVDLGVSQFLALTRVPATAGPAIEQKLDRLESENPLPVGMQVDRPRSGRKRPRERQVVHSDTGWSQS